VSRYEFKLPDLGEGTVDAEIVEWKVKPGDRVTEEDTIVDVMTDKATIEVPSPVSGTVVSTTGEPGDLVPVGAVLIVFETDVKASAPSAAPSPKAIDANAAAAKGPTANAPAKGLAPNAPAKGRAANAPDARAPIASAAVTKGGSKPNAASSPKLATSREKPGAASSGRATPQPVRSVAPKPPASTQTNAARVLTSPSIRRRAREAGTDLAELHGTGPDGRITQADIDEHLKHDKKPQRGTPTARPSGDDVDEVKVIGVRRVIAQRLSESKRTIPHFAYVEEVDVTALESLRAHLNAERQESLTYLPFLGLALIRALADFPQCNAHYDAERNVLMKHHRVHLGVATQTPDGLKVPVVHGADALSLWDLAHEIRRVADAARDGTAAKEELGGSTITITSLGKLGGIASTPIINAPEVAIIGVNKAVQRPVVVDGAIAVRLMMNLSSSFDHRFVDGYDAAALVQALKGYLEQPATIFV
jgi:2-oxoisovalerate dehydrogenase E2 component (dihydrolipoyl transacylase)